MRGWGRLILTVPLAALAFCSALLATYLYSNLRWGPPRFWGEPELPPGSNYPAVIPIVVSALAMLLLVAIAWMYKRGQGAAAVVRLTAILMAGCGAASVGLFFGLMANCSLSCADKVVAEVKSPNGRLRAVRSVTSCAAMARYCPPYSRIAVVSTSLNPAAPRKDAFRVTDVDYVTLTWKADDLLFITYAGEAKILHQQNRTGAVRLKYWTFGWM